MTPKLLLSAAMAAALLAVPVTAKSKGEDRLARLLKGRVAERPVRCISQTQARDAQIIDRTAIVYGSGRVIYVNRTANPRSINSSYVMVYRNRSGQLCRLDTIRLLDSGTRMSAGFISLENFVPWRRVK